MIPAIEESEETEADMDDISSDEMSNNSAATILPGVIGGVCVLGAVLGALFVIKAKKGFGKGKD